LGLTGIDQCILSIHSVIEILLSTATARAEVFTFKVPQPSHRVLMAEEETDYLVDCIHVPIISFGIVIVKGILEFFPRLRQFHPRMNFCG